ncbi:hypothetical protein [Acinetobacter sp. 1125_18A]|uniref:hypothetical protein n=1 Tax=Acinetobacter sp. 1125_18A TaxID=2605959 RepID=UPI00405A00CD
MFSINTSKKIPVWKSLDFYKENWSLIIFLPALLGGVLQIIKLFNLDPSFVRFFAVEQVVPDGLLILFLTILAWIIYFIFRKSINENNLKKITLGWNLKNIISNLSSTFAFLLFSLIMVSYLSFVSYFEIESITIGYLVFKTVIEFFILKCIFDIFFTLTLIYIFRNYQKVSDIPREEFNKAIEKLQNLPEKTIPFLIFTFLTFGILFIILTKINLFYSHINKLNLPMNEKILTIKLKNQLKTDVNLNIEYYNGKYVFFRIENQNNKNEYLVLKGESLINILEK